MGISGRIAQAFLRSKLTPLVTIASLAVGLIGIMATPREEEPQISVPMIDVIAVLPGAGPAEVETAHRAPAREADAGDPGRGPRLHDGRRRLRDDHGAVRCRRGPGAQHHQGARQARCGDGQAPPGALPPMIKPHSIDDVPDPRAHPAQRGERCEHAAAGRAAPRRGGCARCRGGGDVHRGGSRGRWRCSSTRRGSRRAA
jgi:hypothetical protein